MFIVYKNDYIPESKSDVINISTTSLITYVYYVKCLLYNCSKFHKKIGLSRFWSISVIKTRQIYKGNNLSLNIANSVKTRYATTDKINRPKQDMSQLF